MADPNDFSSGFNMGSGLVGRAMEVARARMQMEHEKKMFPIKLQELGLEKQGMELELKSKANQNEFQAKRDRDSARFQEFQVLLGQGVRPKTSFETTEFNNAAQSILADSELEQSIKNQTSLWKQRVANLDGEQIAALLEVPLGNGGVPTGKHWKMLRDAEAVTNARKDQRELDNYQLKQNIYVEGQKQIVDERNKATLASVMARANAQINTIQDRQKRSRLAGMIKAINSDKNLSADQKVAKIEELSIDDSPDGVSVPPPKPSTGSSTNSALPSIKYNFNSRLDNLK